MAKYLPFLIVGGLMCMNGLPLLIFGIMLRIHYFSGEPYPPGFEPPTGIAFLIIGALIIIVALILLSIGLYKRSHRFEYID